MAQTPAIHRFPVIAGPTAGGKSDLAVQVALELERQGLGRGEVVTADAYQIYKSLDIGTAKPTPDEMAGVTHHLIDIVEPTERFTVSQWLEQAEQCIKQIRSAGNTPIIVGGTHLYLKAFLEGLFQGPEPDPALRKQLEAIAQKERRAELDRVDPAAAARIHPNDERRTIRALEVYRQTGTPISEWQIQWDQDSSARTDCVLIGLDWQPETINPRINQRVKKMMNRGLLDEVQALHKAARLGPQAAEALGYKQLLRHLRGEWTLEEAVEQIKIETRRFAKNQRTWLRRLRSTPGSAWIDAAQIPAEDWAQLVISQCVRAV